MSDVRCLVVCEGSSDHSVIEGIVKEVGRSKGKNFQSILLAPELDATSDRYEKFGYEGVKNWCQYNNCQYSQFGRNKIASLLAWHSADLIFIHLDADIADRLELNRLFFSNGIKNRKEWCCKVLDSWFGDLKNHIKCFYVVPTMQIESWLLATFDNVTNPSVFSVEIEDYELVIDVEKKLLAIGYDEDREKPGRIYKEKSLYEKDKRYVPRLIDKLDVASIRCSELSNFIRILENNC